MPINYQFTMALKALREVQAELGQEPIPGQTLFPGLADVLDELKPLPPEALLFGIASDGLPLLLNMRDPSTGPLLILADRGSGKTAFLQFLAESTNRLLSAEKVHYTILTDFPDEWDKLEIGQHGIGIIPAYEPAAVEMLYELACQAEAGSPGPITLLLFDGLDASLHIDPIGQENLRYLLECGPQAGVWPIVTVNAGFAAKMPEWLSLFRTRIYGRIAHPDLADELTPLPGAGLNTLFPGTQFCLRLKSHWLRFWLPSL